MKSQIYKDQAIGALVQDGINTAEQLKAERMAEILQTAIEKESMPVRLFLKVCNVWKI